MNDKDFWKEYWDNHEHPKKETELERKYKGHWNYDRIGFIDTMMWAIAQRVGMKEHDIIEIAWKFRLK